jgi:methylmalonyl-CoA mutase N-terminal domain/subunit
VVGVNDFVKEDEEIEIPLMEIGLEAEEKQKKKLIELRGSRDQTKVDAALKRVEETSRDGSNLVPPIVAAAKEMATMGEIVDSMKTVFGEWTETPVV